MKLPAILILAMTITPATAASFSTEVYKKTITEVYRITIGSFNYTCNVHTDKSPFSNCISLWTKLASKNETFAELDKSLRIIVPQLKTVWRNFADYCLPFGKYATSANSTGCLTAKNSLIKNGYYYGSDGAKINVTNALTESWIQGLDSIYGAAASKTPAILWPEADIVMKWDSTGTSLKKRTLAFGSIFSDRQLSCNKDESGNPYQDCLEILAVYCAYDVTVCKSAVDTVFEQLNPSWKSYLSNCASWKNNKNYQQGNSTACANAGNAVVQNSRDITYLSFISDALVGSMKVRLWTNQTILKSPSTSWSSKYLITNG